MGHGRGGGRRRPGRFGVWPKAHTAQHSTARPARHGTYGTTMACATQHHSNVREQSTEASAELHGAVQCNKRACGPATARGRPGLLLPLLRTGLKQPCGCRSLCVRCWVKRQAAGRAGPIL